jgi:hypothetical protein
MRGKFVRPVSKTIFSILLGLLQLSPALAQPVSLSDLEGSTIQAEVDREQKIRREGNLRSVRIQVDREHRRYNCGHASRNPKSSAELRYVYSGGAAAGREQRRR